MAEPLELLNIATEIARGAGQILRQGAQVGFGQVDTKSSAVDVVTATDKRSEEFISKTLFEMRPDDGILGEEGASRPSKTGVEWVIDPLDGTVNFIYGIPLYAVSIGATIDGVPVAGVVFNPAMDELFSGASGKGAFLNGQPIECSVETEIGLSLLATGFSYDAQERANEGAWLAEILSEVRDVRRTGSAALDICFLACGRIDILAQSGLREWDIAAGMAIAREAGAKVSREQVNDLDRNVIGANPGLYEAAEALVKPLPKTQDK